MTRFSILFWNMSSKGESVVDSGIMNGKSSHRFAAQVLATGAEAAVVIYRIFAKPPSFGMQVLARGVEPWFQIRSRVGGTQ